VTESVLMTGSVRRRWPDDDSLLRSDPNGYPGSRPRCSRPRWMGRSRWRRPPRA